MKKIVCVLLAFSLLLSGCIEEKKNVSTNKENYIICSFGELPASLNIWNSEQAYYNGMSTYLFEGLVSMDRKGKIQSGLAEDWTISSDGIGYTFNIREDAKWSDGSSITPDDFVTFFKNILSSKLGDNLAYDLYPVYGAENYSKGKANFDSVAIRAVGGNKLEIRLNKACPDFLKILSQPQYTLRKGSDLLKNWQEAYKQIKYTGAFMVDNIDSKGVVLVKNPNYWDSSEVTNDKFLVLNKISAEEAYADYEGDKINLLLNPPISEMERVMSSDNSMIMNSEEVIALSLNPSNKRATKDIALREAIAATINVDDLREKYLSEFQPEEYNIFKKANVYSNFNLKIDEKYLKDEDNKKVIRNSLVLMAVNNDINKRVCKGIAEQLQDKLNVSVQVKYIMEDEFEAQSKGGEYDMLLGEVKGDYDKKMSIFKALRSDNPLNWSGLKDTDLDNNLKMAQYIGDDKGKDEYVKKCSEVLAKNFTFVPLFKKVDILVKSNYIDGIEVDSQNSIILNKITGY